MSLDGRTNILLVDDLQENLNALAQAIASDGLLIHQATSGEAALSLLLEHEFALVILDVMMPGMNGFELAELMRGTERTSHIPIIFVSAAGREMNYAFKGYESGAVDFLHKPVDVAAVRSKVNVFVALYQQRQEVRRQVVALQKVQSELSKTQVELQDALTIRDEFISMVAHELRTPLNTLHLEVQMRQLLLSKNDASAFTMDKLAGMFARDSRQIQNMNRLIADMVDVSRIESGNLALDMGSVKLSDALRRVVADLSQQAETAACEVRLEIAPALDELVSELDEFRLQQILVNLLTNAFRYGAGKPVTLSLRLVDGKAVIGVKDRGAGIDEAQQQRIFQKFERLGTNLVKEGLGMGLYIARQLTEAQGGTLQVESRLGEGAEFRLVLPVKHTEQCTRAAPAA